MNKLLLIIGLIFIATCSHFLYKLGQAEVIDPHRLCAYKVTTHFPEYKFKDIYHRSIDSVCVGELIVVEDIERDGLLVEGETEHKEFLLTNETEIKKARKAGDIATGEFFLVFGLIFGIGSCMMSFTWPKEDEEDE